jgi:rubrerythrin
MTLFLTILAAGAAVFFLGYRIGRAAERLHAEALAERREPVKQKLPMHPPTVLWPRVYECPVCGSTDPSAYVRCNRPDCTDGRDPR